jgi:hypothetical protein
MRFNKRHLGVMAALAGLVIAAGAAYTNSLSTSAAVAANPGYQVVGYGNVTVTDGGTLLYVQYNLDGNDPANVTSVTFVMSGNTTGDEGYVGFGKTGKLGAACDPVYGDTAGTTTYATDTTYVDCGLPDAADIPVGTTTLGSLDLAVIPGPVGGGPLG